MGDRSELRRLLDDCQLAHPRPVRDRQGRMRRDPAGEWDWFYGLDDGLRRWIVRHAMGPAGSGLAPDQLAALAHFEYVDEWATAFVQACQVARDRSAADDWEQEFTQDDDGELIGPDELAELLQVTRAALRKMRERAQLPRHEFELSRMPIWTLGAVREWAAETGRTIDTTAA